MGIEKPFEVETRELKPLRRIEHGVGIGERVDRAVRVRAGDVEICGMHLRPPSGTNATRAAAAVREKLRRRMLERWPNADARTWRRFQEEARAVLRSRMTADEETVDALRRTIDGL